MKSSRLVNFSTIVSVAVVLLTVLTVKAAGGASVVTPLADVRAVTVKGVAMVPVDSLAQALGAAMKLNADAQLSSKQPKATVVLTQPGLVVKLTSGSVQAYANGASFQLPCAPYISQGVIFTPLVGLSQKFGCQVNRIAGLGLTEIIPARPEISSFTVRTSSGKVVLKGKVYTDLEAVRLGADGFVDAYMSTYQVTDWMAYRYYALLLKDVHWDDEQKIPMVMRSALRSTVRAMNDWDGAHGWLDYIEQGGGTLYLHMPAYREPGNEECAGRAIETIMKIGTARNDSAMKNSPASRLKSELTELMSSIKLIGYKSDIGIDVVYWNEAVQELDKRTRSFMNEVSKLPSPAQVVFLERVLEALIDHTSGSEYGE